MQDLIPGDRLPRNGFWALLIEPPRNARGRTVVIEGDVAPVQWLERPSPLNDGNKRLFQDWAPSLERSLRNAASDPLNRWRTRLLDDRLSGPRRTVIDQHATIFEEHAIEAMALQAQWRWRLALDSLSRIDPFLGAELLDRLTAVVRFDQETLAPAWPTDEAKLTALRSALLDPETTDAAKLSATRETLSALQATTAWVIDDAGWVDPRTGRTTLLAGVADRSGRPTLARLSLQDRSGPSTGLPALGVTRATVEAPKASHGGDMGAVNAHVEVTGREEITLPTLPVGLPVEPPGFRLGPGSAPWTLGAWSDGVPEQAAPGLSFYALLHRRAPASQDRSWQLHVECPTPPGADDGTLYVHLGPSNEPVVRLRVDPAGLMTDEIGAPMRREPVVIRRTDDAWIATIDIPQRAIEPDGLLRLAIERVDSRGGRATWPRPTLPWVSAPGRAALDLTAWRGLGPEGAGP